jgi:hypothetical protein
MGSAGIGTQTHLAAENFALSAGIDVTHVPYKGESLALTDLMGGQIQLVTPNLGAAISLIQQGKLKALGVTSPQRSPQLPDVPGGRRGDSRLRERGLVRAHGARGDAARGDRPRAARQREDPACRMISAGSSRSRAWCR